FFEQVSVVEDGARGSAFQCENTQKLAFRADHNIYAERGTLSFWWRSRYPVGPTQFPIFRVAFADHSSWDACWLRIDYNGEGFEAMITDINLSKARVAAKVEPFPAPDVWTHLTLSWDENWGIRFYINGKLAAEEYRPAVYFTGLDQFGTHSRIISNWNVSSDYNFVRGGDVDEIVIYDRMLSDAQIALLAQGEFVTDLEEYAPDLTDKTTADAWLLRCGFAPVAPAAIPDEASVRKVEIHDAYDLKRWWWKACDGIRETTWPGVFNRSRLKGRNDYFQLPDWDCYSLSGKAVTFWLPEEEYNHIEISGSAFGLLESVTDTDEAIETVFDRPAGTERTSVRIAPRTGGRLRFTNVLQEEPIGDFSVFNVQEGSAPAAVKTVSYTLTPGYNDADPAQNELAYFIKGRYTAYERHIMTATETGEQQPCQDNAPGYPFVNVIVPYEFDESVALDGITLTIPAQESDCDFAIQIRDPLWYHRNLAHFTFHAEAGHAKTIWFDLRDRCLPEQKCLYIQIACSDTAFGTANLADAKLSLVYKPAEDAKEEHCLDRFTQIRDLYSHLVEEQPGLPEFDMYNRFMADITDLLRIDPKHQPGQFYLYDKRVLCTKYGNNIEYTPDFEVPTAPEGVPEWAFQQVEYLKRYKKLINWWIDNRQIENGEFGGGLSDDGDYTSFWPGLAEMGCDPEKIRASIDRCTDAFYEQGLFTNGLPSIQTDELHTAEEGLISLDQCLSTMYSHPKYLERVMETCRSLEWITGFNCAG
ncbi:MAG: LamG domain-containing protein, partial [Oscillospiraceae bacterium]|nr:LamG domain-containing protein [Oscillospiraceae bacterium]